MPQAVVEHPGDILLFNVNGEKMLGSKCLSCVVWYHVVCVCYNVVGVSYTRLIEGERMGLEDVFPRLLLGVPL